MKTQKMKISELVFDENLLSLRQINDQVVSRYKQALLTGAEFPPLVIEKGTNRIASGNHRTNAMIEAFGHNYEAEVIVKKFASEKDFLLEAVRENSSHGNPLSGFERKSLSASLHSHGATNDEMAKAFGVLVHNVECWLGGTVAVVIIGQNKSQVVQVETEQRPVKRCFPTDREITKPQWEEHNKKDLGLPIGQLASQISRWIKNDYIERNEANLSVLLTLKEALDGFFAKADSLEAEGDRLNG